MRSPWGLSPAVSEAARSIAPHLHPVHELIASQRERAHRRGQAPAPLERWPRLRSRGGPGSARELAPAPLSI